MLSVALIGSANQYRDTESQLDEMCYIYEFIHAIASAWMLDISYKASYFIFLKNGFPLL